MAKLPPLAFKTVTQFRQGVTIFTLPISRLPKCVNHVTHRKNFVTFAGFQVLNFVVLKLINAVINDRRKTERKINIFSKEYAELVEQIK